MKNKNIRRIAEAIQAWASQRNANVLLESYSFEIEHWKKLTGEDKVSSVLEVGCGSGLFLLSVVALGFAEFGVGIDPCVQEDGTAHAELEEAKALANEIGLKERLTFKYSTFQEVISSEEYTETNFDVLMFRNVLHHIYEREHNQETDKIVRKKCINDLATARLRLKDNGHICIREEVAPNHVYGILYNQYRKARGSPTINWAGKRTKHEWENILRQAGYKRIRYKRFPINRFIYNVVGRVIGKYLSASFLISGRR